MIIYPMGYICKSYFQFFFKFFRKALFLGQPDSFYPYAVILK